MEQQKKIAIISQFGHHEGDTGSTEVQIALLTERINLLTEHLAANKRDAHSKHSLLKLVGQRRRLLRYINQQEVSRYQSLIKKLGLRK